MQQRLQKLIAQAGLASRRHAEEMITAGQVNVNGKIVTELGAKADPEIDHIKVKGRLINPLLQNHERLYILLNKPRGYLSSMSDPDGRPLVTELIPTVFGRLYPVGRLDFNSEGLLLLTNDGELTNIVTSAKNRIAKVYQVKVKGLPPENAIERLRRGIAIGEGERTRPAEVKQLKSSDANAWFEITLREGRNQQIRRMFDAIGHSVTKLKRTQIGPLEDRRLASGEWRSLTPVEVRRLKSASSGKTAAPLPAKAKPLRAKPKPRGSKARRVRSRF
jgi:23S rRNA pseudouridine2605 synthase